MAQPIMSGQGRPPLSALAAGWRAQPISLRVLRLFLGATFLYAGLQKLHDPNFLHAGNPGYIGTQLTGFARGSPIGSILLFLAHHTPVATGIVTALAELAIGLATLLMVAPLLAAVGGFGLSTALWLSASWHVYPYFLGPDSIYAIAWLAYGIGVIERAGQAVGARSGHAGAAHDPGRRRVLRGAALGTTTLVLGGLAAALAGEPTLSRARPGGIASSRSGRGGGKPHSPGGSGEGHGAAGGQGSSTGQDITALDNVPVGAAIGFKDPASANPAVLVRLSTRDVVAYSRVCTHAGCLVGYDTRRRLLECPCHGAVYDPAHGAAVVAGPAPQPLPSIPVTVDGSGRVRVAQTS